MAITKTTLTAAARGATAPSRVLGLKVSAQADVPVDSAATPATALVVVSSLAGEQQRPSEVAQRGGGVLAD